MVLTKSLKFSVQKLVILLRVALAGALIFLGYLLYRIFFNSFIDGNFILPVLAIWLLTAYFVLPRIHRLLTKLYVPDYYIGRTKSADGFYGDPVNVALFGTEKQLVEAMKKAGWVEAEELNFKTSLKMTIASVLKKSYPSAPVSSLFLFRRKQDYAFQQEINDNPHSRHHVRFWRVPEGWVLPGGHEVDWLGSATFDTNVGLSWFTFQFTHRIDENIDDERDHLLSTLKKSGKVSEIEIVQNFTTAYHTRNGGGDRVRTDGAMPFVKLDD